MLQHCVKSYLLVFMVAGATCIGPSWGADDEASPEAMTSMFLALGFKQTNSISSAACKVIVDVDQATVIKSVPLLQKLDVLNSDKTANELTQEPIKTTMATAIQIAAMQLKSFYDANASADKCQFAHNLISNDDYGNPRKYLMFSYGFDRGTYTKINWQNFRSPNLMKVSKGFTFNPEMGMRMRSE
ncbi:hypothetical protein MKK55_14460 [Methylobacterium sp. J-059]|uniref:hypothetical protein n=1 Tax=Methylobacterium sp. J-059 TaxID=2836643 RepID=UPI001FB86CCB|nr:hypothetical protein [Methylobacterium sp. J-059]MCJ2040133.1 hypothetical protein [Methylobacterium sp. J-059]